MDDVVEDVEWLQQVDEVYDKLSVQHPIYYDSCNLCDLCQSINQSINESIIFIYTR